MIKLNHPRLAARDRGYWSRLLLTRWPWIVAMTVVVTGGAALVCQLQTPMYRSQAVVAISPASSSAGSTVQPYVMGTEKGIASSGNVLSIASQALLVPVGRLRRGLSITVPVDADLLQISFSDPNPQVAQSVADGIAQAYVQYRSAKPAVTSGKASTTATTEGGVQATVVTDAFLPSAPISPDRTLIIGVALILGLALGVGLALLRDEIDDGLRGALDLQAQAAAPVLAQIPAYHRRSLVRDLVVVRSPDSTVANAYRDLRTRVLQAAAWRHADTLLVTSAGREDKSAIAANLAAALALSGRRVTLVSADLRWGQAHALFGLANRFGLASVLSGDATLAIALQPARVPGLQVLTSGPPTSGPVGLSVPGSFAKVLTELRNQGQFVVIDAPPVLASADTGALAELGMMILLAADARLSTRAEVRAAAQELGHVRDDLVGCVLDNVGAARRLPEISIAVAMGLMNERATAGHSPTAVPSANAPANGGVLQEMTSIHGEG